MFFQTVIKNLQPWFVKKILGKRQSLNASVCSKSFDFQALLYLTSANYGNNYFLITKQGNTFYLGTSFENAHRISTHILCSSWWRKHLLIHLITNKSEEKKTTYTSLWKKGIPMEQLGHFKILQLFTGLYLAKRKMFTSLAQHKGI